MIDGAVREPASRGRAEAVVLTSLTIRGWPRRIEPAEPFPHPFRRAYQELHLAGEEQPCILYSPRARFGLHENTAKLLVWSGRRLACLDARHGGVVTTTLLLDHVHEVEWGQALLESWLRLVATGPGGRTVIRVEFNTVGLELYKPIADTARSVAYAGAHLAIDDQRPKLAPLARLDARFAACGAQALLSGVELRRHWFQPRVAGGFRRVAGGRIPGLLLMVTQAELVLVQEQGVRGSGGYGTVWRCLPLQSIRAATLVPDLARGLTTLHLSLPDDSEARVDVDPAGTDGLRAFLRETDERWGELEPPLPAPVPFESSEGAPPP